MQIDDKAANRFLQALTDTDDSEDRPASVQVAHITINRPVRCTFVFGHTAPPEPTKRKPGASQ